MGPLSKGVRDLFGAGRRSAGAVVRRFAPRASEFLNGLKEDPKKPDTSSRAENPVEAVPETDNELSADHKHDDVILLNALLNKFVQSIPTAGNMAVLGPTGNFAVLTVTTRPSMDPLDVFSRQIFHVFGTSSAVKVSVSDRDMEPFQDQIPDEMGQLHSKIVGLMTEMDFNVIVSAGTGSFVALSLGDIPEDADPVQVFMDRLVHHRCDGGSSHDNGKTDPSGINPFDHPEGSQGQPAPASPGNKKISVENILEPFDEVFLAPDILNRALTAVGLQQLTKAALNKENLLTQIKKGEVSFPNGTILNGPPGTGKSVLMEGMAESYRRAGAFALEIKEGELHDGLVGGPARFLTKKFDQAIAQAKKTGLPSLVVIDEGSTLALTVNSGDSTRRYHQGGIDTLKNFITKHPEVVVVLATNVANDELDHALTRSLRLEVITIDKPDAEQQGRMFAHFLKKYGVIETLTDEQLGKLVKVLPDAQGADIRKFAQGYLERLILKEHQKQGRRTVLDVIRHYFIDNGDELTPDDVHHLITFEKVLDDLKEFAATLRAGQTGSRRVGYA